MARAIATETMRVSGRASVFSVFVAPLAALLVAACGGETKTGAGPVPALGAGYGGATETDEVRALSRDDCVALRDHQIDIAVADALGDDATQTGKRLEIEAKLRAQMKPETDAWVKRCSGKIIRAADLRCMKDATTPDAFLACGATEDAGLADGSPVDAARD